MGIFIGIVELSLGSRRSPVFRTGSVAVVTQTFYRGFVSSIVYIEVFGLIVFKSIFVETAGFWFHNLEFSAVELRSTANTFPMIFYRIRSLLAIDHALNLGPFPTSAHVLYADLIIITPYSVGSLSASSMRLSLSSLVQM